MRNRKMLLTAIILGTLLAGYSGSYFAPGDWYRGLEKPAWTPPGSVIGPVWGVLFVLMFVAAWLVWRRPVSRLGNHALLLYGLQLVLNGMWSFFFFGLNWITGTLIGVILLFVTIAAAIRAFGRVDRRAAWLLVPYLLWVGFDVVWHVFIWRLNA